MAVEISTATYGDNWAPFSTDPDKCQFGANDGLPCIDDGDCPDGTCNPPPPQPDFLDISKVVQKFQAGASVCEGGETATGG